MPLNPYEALIPRALEPPSFRLVFVSLPVTYVSSLTPSNTAPSLAWPASGVAYQWLHHHQPPWPPSLIALTLQPLLLSWNSLPPVWPSLGTTSSMPSPTVLPSMRSPHRPGMTSSLTCSGVYVECLPIGNTMAQYLYSIEALSSWPLLRWHGIWGRKI